MVESEVEVFSFDDLSNIEHFGSKVLEDIRAHLKVTSGEDDHSSGSEQRRKVR